MSDRHDVVTTASDAVLSLGVDHRLIDQYFGVWAVEPDRFQQMVQRAQGTNIVAHVGNNRDSYRALDDLDAQLEFVHKEKIRSKVIGESRLFRSVKSNGNQVAIIEVRGTVQKFRSSFEDATSTVFVRRQLSQAVADEDIDSIMLVIDSPGGTVAGTQDLADAITRARTKKPVHAFVEDLTASAAFWIASQTERITANNPTALIGSIGTYAVLFDQSKQAEKLGIQVHVVKAGDFKGAGVPGTEITEEHLANVQRIVNSLNSEFLKGVARGRNLAKSKVEELADGRIHPAVEAQSMGLVDGIESLDQAIANLTQRRPRATMAKDTNEPQAASLAELKENFPQAGSDFWVAQLDANATLLQAHTAHAKHVAEENAKLKAEMEAKDKAHAEALKEASEKAAAGGTGSAGVTPLGEQSSDDQPENYVGSTGDAVVDFDAAVRQRMKSGNLDRIRAVAAVAKANPAMHQAFLLATNARSPKARRQLTEKYGVEEAAAK